MTDMNIKTLPRKIEPSAATQSEFSNAALFFSQATPMIAYQFYNCGIIWTDEIPTAAAAFYNEKPVIIINEDFFMGLNSHRERAFLLFHENMHIYAHHIGRQTDMAYNPQLWNIATDFYINYVAQGYYLDENGKVQQEIRYKDAFTFIEGGLFDPKYIGFSSDEIYRMLLEENDGDAQKALSQFAQPGEGDSGKPGAYDIVSDEQMTHAEKAKTNQVSAAAIAKATKEKSIGTNEGHIARVFETLFKPKINWRDQLVDAIKSSSKERPTYNRLSRRSQDSDICFPGMTGERINVIMGIDTSGSMSEDDINEGLAELSGIIEQYEGWKLTLVSCDTNVHVIGEYDSDFGDDFTSIDKTLIGGGGTILQPIVDYAVEEYETGNDVNACIIFTDGYIPELYSSNPDIQIIVVVSSGGNRELSLSGIKVIFMDDVGK